MMANGGNIAKDTLFEPERLAARAIDWDLRCRGLSSGRAVKALQLRRRIHGRSRSSASFNRKALAPREPSIHGSSPMAEVMGLQGTLRANKSETFDSLKFTLWGAGERSDGNARTPAHALFYRA